VVIIKQQTYSPKSIGSSSKTLVFLDMRSWTTKILCWSCFHTWCLLPLVADNEARMDQLGRTRYCKAGIWKWQSTG